MNYRQIDQNTEEGFQDLEFDIVESRYEEERNHFLVFGQYRNEVVGFEIIVRNDMLPGIVQGQVNEEAFYGAGITLKSIGPNMKMLHLRSFLTNIMNRIYTASFISIFSCRTMFLNGKRRIPNIGKI